MVTELNKPAGQNTELAGIFRQMASCYRYLGPTEKFRAVAYENAARTIAGLDEDINVYAKDAATLDKLKGIGESISEKIMEYLETGKIKTHESLLKTVPAGLLELMEINGFGPATIKTLHEKLKVNTRDDLVKALEEEKIKTLEGFGPKKIENMKRALKLYKDTHTLMPLPEAINICNGMLNEIKKIP
ncbi:MAG TPA: helix-hairpin-helix domain-containing protein, partial [Chitinophagaceae bacterium]